MPSVRTFPLNADDDEDDAASCPLSWPTCSDDMDLDPTDGMGGTVSGDCRIGGFILLSRE